MLCALILYMSDRTYSLTSTPNDRFLRNFSWQFYLLSEFFPEICWEEVAEEIFFIFRFDALIGIRTRALRLISQHTTYLTTATSNRILENLNFIHHTRQIHHTLQIVTTIDSPHQAIFNTTLWKTNQTTTNKKQIFCGGPSVCIRPPNPTKFQQHTQSPANQTNTHSKTALLILYVGTSIFDGEIFVLGYIWLAERATNMTIELMHCGPFVCIRPPNPTKLKQHT